MDGFFQQPCYAGNNICGLSVYSAPIVIEGLYFSPARTSAMLNACSLIRL